MAKKERVERTRQEMTTGRGPLASTMKDLLQNEVVSVVGKLSVSYEEFKSILTDFGATVVSINAPARSPTMVVKGEYKNHSKMHSDFRLAMARVTVSPRIVTEDEFWELVDTLKERRTSGQYADTHNAGDAMGNGPIVNVGKQWSTDVPKQLGESKDNLVRSIEEADDMLSELDEVLR